MRKQYRYFLLVLAPVAIALLAIILTRHHTVAILEPRGTLATKERNLMFFALGLSLIVVIPVYVMTFFFAWHYREGNTKATYSPDFDRSKIAESIWWGVPSILIIILSVVAWNSSHTLDPSQPLTSNNKSITIDVVALDWKWLFIYPKQNIATVNFLEIPKSTPVNFQISADAPMNSFWIPQLSGQIYAMPGMTTELHVMGTQDGEYYGSSANISGEGFATMHFMTKVADARSFNLWTQSIERTPNTMSEAVYNQLAKPSGNLSPAYYAPVASGLYDRILRKYMSPTQTTTPSSKTGTPQTSMANMGM